VPELPEVETTLRGIQPYVEKSTLVGVTVRNGSLRWPVPVKDIQSLVGQDIQSTTRRAKYILMQTERGALMLHLGMSGSVRVLDAEQLPELKKHDHIDLVFEQAGSKRHVLRYHDPRRFGSLLFVDNNQGLHPLLEKLGPEPLSKEFNADYLFKSSRKRSVAIKNYVMDGHVVVGVGNIYASESLFMAGVRPTRPANKVTRKEYELIIQAIKKVLAKAISVGGTTLRDFTQSDGQAGYFQQKLNVYDQDGKECNICSKLIKRIVIGQRSSFYCPNCQR